MEIQIVYIAAIVILLIISIILFVKLNANSKKYKYLISENKKLVSDNSLLEADHLKFQLKPHTLNNILANLKVFASKLHKGMESLSGTLSYILYQGNRSLASVNEEIDFIKKYLQLNDLFISEIDSVRLDDSNVDIRSKYYTNPCVPHLITAHFIENAFKHGNTEHPNFLRIEISLNNKLFKYHVINKIKYKKIDDKVGIGLQNMKRRLELLHVGKYDVTQSCNEEEYHSILTIEFNK